MLWVPTQFWNKWKKLKYEIGFQDLEKVLNLDKMCIKYWKSVEIPNSGICLFKFCSLPLVTVLQMFLHCLPSIKFSKNQATVNDGIKVFNLVLKRCWKSMENGFWKCVGTLFLLHRTKIPLVLTTKVTYFRSLLFRQHDGFKSVVRGVYFGNLC